MGFSLHFLCHRCLDFQKPALQHTGSCVWPGGSESAALLSQSRANNVSGFTVICSVQTKQHYQTMELPEQQVSRVVIFLASTYMRRVSQRH
jgi:hypothetical protein